MKTTLLYLDDCYKKDFYAKVLERGENYIVLDKTAFYPAGGGQPCDKGKLNGVSVTDVRKKDGSVLHFVLGTIQKDDVFGEIDWDLRYKHMRMHTAQHILSVVALEKYGAVTAGNQIKESMSRIDFNPLKVNSDVLSALKKEFDAIIDRRLAVKKFFCKRQEVLDRVDEKRRNLFLRVPETINEIRVVEIEGVDLCPCAGTHVDNTSEIGHINILRHENKGKDTTRIYFELI